MNQFTDQDYQLMDQYLNKQMSETERKAFEQRLQTEPEWAEELLWIQKLEANYRFLRLKDHVIDIQKRVAQTGFLDEDLPIEKSFWNTLGRRLTIAASVVLVLGGSWYIWQSNPSRSSLAGNSPTLSPAPSEQIPEEVTTLDLAAVTSGYAAQLPKDLPTPPSDLLEAIQAYQNNQPAEALAALDKQTQIKPIQEESLQNTEDKPLFGSGQNAETTQNNTVSHTKSDQFRQLYMGLSYLKLGKASQALAPLKKVNIAQLKPTAEWYEALALLQLSRQEDAKRILTRIKKDPNHLYQLEAEELLQGIQ